MKRWGLRATSLSAVVKADAGQNALYNHLNPNVLYMMCAPCILFENTVLEIFVYGFIVVAGRSRSDFFLCNFFNFIGVKSVYQLFGNLFQVFTS